MKDILLILALVISNGVFATNLKAAEQNKSGKFFVHGQWVELEEYYFNQKTQKLEEGRLAEKSYIFNFADGNKIKLSSNYFYLNSKGNFKLIFSPGYLDYIHSDKSIITLNCAEHIYPRQSNRVVAFHPNGRYKTGCQSMAKSRWFSQRGHSLNVGKNSNLELDSVGNLVYANIILENSYISLSKGEPVYLDPFSEVNFHENGNIHFFTPKIGEKIDFISGNFGNIYLGFSDFKFKSAVVLRDNGILKLAPVSDVFLVNQGEDTVALKPLIVSLYITGEIAIMFFSREAQFPDKVKPYVVFGPNDTKVICLDKLRQIRSISHCANSEAI